MSAFLYRLFRELAAVCRMFTTGWRMVIHVNHFDRCVYYRVASRFLLPKRSYCLTYMLPKSGRCLMMVLPKPRRHGYGHRDQRSHEDRGGWNHPQPVQAGFERRQEQDA